MSGCDFPVMTQADVAALAALEKREAHKEALRRLFASTDELPTTALAIGNVGQWGPPYFVQSAVTTALHCAAGYRRWHAPSDRISRPRLLTIGGGEHVPNRARHVPPRLRDNLRLFVDDHGCDAIAGEALGLMHCHAWLAWRKDRRLSSGIRPRRVTPDGMAIVRGRR